MSYVAFLYLSIRLLQQHIRENIRELHSFIRLFGFCNSQKYLIFKPLSIGIFLKTKVSRLSASRFIKTHLKQKL